MAEREEPSVLRLVVVFLRFYSDMTQVEFGKASRVDQSEISKYEKGTKTPSEESLRRMAQAANLDWPLVAHLHRSYKAILSISARQNVIPDVQPPDPALLESVLLAITPYLLAARETEPWRLQSPEEERREAEEIWTVLERQPIPRRRKLIELAPRASRSCALVARVCAASLRAASHDAREALELAELALAIAEGLPGEEELRSRAQAFSWGHVGNARRVGNDLDGADEVFTYVWELWRGGHAADSELFPEWQLFSLEASLRRAQRRLPEALELLSRAWTVCGGEPIATARILLKKETVLDLMGDIEGALAFLSEATPLIEATGDRDLLLRFSFNMAVDLCHLERFSESAELLPQVRELAIEQANELDLLRLVWLEARIDAGQNRTAAAQAGLEQVRRMFIDRGMLYDAALASLDLALIGLRAGHMAKVRELAVEMEAVFLAKKIQREALAALSLFWTAAKSETATLKLVQQVIAEIESAKRLAPLQERPR
jgi:transcriptional regulator with XRE-family HTH domain